MRFVCLLVASFFSLVSAASAAPPKRVALVIGQNVYRSLASLRNPQLDARRMATLLVKHGFEVLSCNGRDPGCFDQTHDGLVDTLKVLAGKSAGADTALIFYAGHGMETEEGNILAPTDAKVDCATWQVSRGVLIEQFLAAIDGARNKVVVIDACRDNPIGVACPPLKMPRKLSFRDIKVPDARDFLLFTSTKPGQQAQDGLAGEHSPFARALLETLDERPEIYFDQVFNQVAKAVIEATVNADFTQIPESLTRGGAPEACLSGLDCAGDMRAAALSKELDDLKSAYAREQEHGETARAYLAEMEKARGRPLSEEERQAALEELKVVSRDLASRNDTRGEQAIERMKAGDAAAAEKLFAEILDAQERESAEIAARAEAKKREAAKAARNIAALSRNTDVTKAVAFLKRATVLDPDDAQTWSDYAQAARTAGRTDEAKAALEQAALKARDDKNIRQRYWATLLLGDIAASQGNLASALRLYETAASMAKPVVDATPGDARWQRDLAVSQSKVGDLLRAQGNVAGGLEKYRATHAILERLAGSNPSNASLQRDLATSHAKMGDVLRVKGDITSALEAHNASRAIREKLAKSSPSSTPLQSDLSFSYMNTGDLLRTQGNFSAALDAFNNALAIRDKLAKSDPGNVFWQRDLAVSQSAVGDVLKVQGDLTGALKAFKASLAFRESIAKADPGNVGWQRDVASSQIAIGDVLKAQGNLGATLDAYTAALMIREKLAAADPGNAGWQGDLAIMQERIGTLRQAQGNIAASLLAHKASLVIRERLAKSDPSNSGWQLAPSYSHINIGDVLRSQGDLKSALSSYTAALAIRENLVKSDAGNAGWQGALAAAYERVGDMQKQLGNLPDALKSIEAALTIRDKLSKADPDNASAQYELSFSHLNVGGMHRLQGRYPEALDAFQAALAIRRKLTKTDPTNIDWLRSIAVIDERIGDVKRAQGKLAEALEAFKASFATYERVANVLDQDNVAPKRDLAASHMRIGDVLRMQGDLAGARDRYNSALAIRDGLVKVDGENLDWRADLAATYGKLGQIHAKLGQNAEALRLLKEGRGIVVTFAEKTGNRIWIGYLKTFNSEIAELEGK